MNTTPQSIQHPAPRRSKLLLSIPETAHDLCVSERTVWRLIAAGQLARVKCGRSIRITSASIRAFVERGGTR